jgi:multiple sugar transport system substrate-binding protein
VSQRKLSRRDFLRLSALTAASAALAGCCPAPEPETVVVTAEPGGEEPIELRIAWWGGDSRATKTITVIELFQELHPHITMLYEFSGWDDHWTKLATQAAGGNLPDIMQHDYARISEWVGNELLLPLDPFADSGILDFTNVADTTLAGGRIDGTLYGVNLGTNALDMEIAVDLLEQAGLDMPAPDWSWDDFEGLCTAINDSLGIWGYAGNSLFHDHMWKQVYMSKGEWVFSEDGKALGYDDDQPAIDQLNRILRMFAAGTAQTLEEAEARAGEAPEQGPMVTSEAVMAFGWSNFIVSQWENMGADRMLKSWPIPRSGDLPAVYIKPSMFFSITRDANYPEEAAMFIDFFTNSIPANAILMADRGVPIASQVKEGMKGFLTQSQQEMFDYLSLVESDSQPVPPPDPVGWADVRDNVFYPEFHDPVLYGLITPEEGAATFREMANEILAAA